MKEEMVLEQINNAAEAIKDVDKALLKKYQKSYSNIAFSSVGKSGLICNVIKDLGVKFPVEEAVANRLPDLNSRSLGVIVTYSGITKDILSFYKYLQTKTSKIIVITSSKALARNAREKGYLVVELPYHYSSASSFFMMLYATLFILKKTKVLGISKAVLDESISKVQGFSKNFKSIQLTNLLKYRLPLIYTWEEYSCLSRLIASSFNLHAKLFCLKSMIPAADYNEVEALAYGDTKVLPIFIRPPLVGPRKIMDKVRFLSTGSEYFDIPKGHKLVQIVYTYMFFELVAERLAKIRGVDPDKRSIIETLKESF